jgi:N6-adenosine-specific RNA methylase IME4
MSKIFNIPQNSAAEDLLNRVQGPVTTILADPPWRFENRTGKMAPEHQRLLRYPTMTTEEILELPVNRIAAARAHLYLWVPNALISEGLEVMKRWGFTYKTNLVWYDIIEACSPGPYLEIFARHSRPGWLQWGNEDVEDASDYPLKRQEKAVQMALFDKPKKNYG